MSVHAAGRVAFLLQDVDTGGVERCFLNLARGFVARGVSVDLYAARFFSGGESLIAPGVNLVRLATLSGQERTRQIVQGLQGSGSSIVIAAQDKDCRLAVSLREVLRDAMHLVLVASVDFDGQLDGRAAGPLRRWRRHRELRRIYGAADQVFCVSHGVAQTMSRILQRPASSFPVLPNPIVTPELDALARAPLDHPWFAPGEPPVVMGVGRLSRIKNFPLLVRAFARVRQRMPLRLLILGDGKQRGELLRLAARLGVADDVALPGFVLNPYVYMRRAGLFVLSSLWEGFGNVLVEAMACGTPVVATDCPSGPAEILGGGKYGPLVPIGNDVVLAEAIEETLRSPLSEEVLKEGAAPYSLASSTAEFLESLGLGIVG